jgi:regulator of protease activity HflC (stomatin/prohibitin superfamily)
MSSDEGAIVGGVLGGAAALFLIVAFFKSFLIVKEKEQAILERWGRFRAVLTPGLHIIVPWIDR